MYSTAQKLMFEVTNVIDVFFKCTPFGILFELNLAHLTALILSYADRLSDGFQFEIVCDIYEKYSHL